jgi:uncharacterized RDD family membrane protein YckC
MSQQIHIQTTQNVALEFAPASIGDRIVATIIDLFVMLAWALLNFMISAIIKVEMNAVWYVMLIAVPIAFYSLVQEFLLNGQTIGKMVMSTQVVRMDGTQPTLGAYVIRWMVRLIDIWIMTGLVALLSVAISGRGQRLGDIAAGTTLIKRKPPVKLSQVTNSKYDPDYIVTYPSVSVFSDKDIVILRAALKKAIVSRNQYLLQRTATKAKEVADINTDTEDIDFLKTLIRDHAHLMLKEAEGAA